MRQTHLHVFPNEKILFQDVFFDLVLTSKVEILIILSDLYLAI